MRLHGHDHGEERAAVNLLFYQPIESGVGRRVRSIHLGLGTFQAKLARGAQPNPLYSVLVGVDRPLAVWSGTSERPRQAQCAVHAASRSAPPVGGAGRPER